LFAVKVVKVNFVAIRQGYDQHVIIQLRSQVAVVARKYLLGKIERNIILPMPFPRLFH
jgi:hypothetical protein